MCWDAQKLVLGYFRKRNEDNYRSYGEYILQIHRSNEDRIIGATTPKTKESSGESPWPLFCSIFNRIHTDCGIDALAL